MLSFRDVFNFDFFRKVFGNIFSTTFCLWFFKKKMFLMLYSTNWPNFIAWLPLHLEISGNMCMAIVFFPACNIINSEINLIFLIKSLFYMIKKSRQKLKYLRVFSCQNVYQNWECAYKSMPLKVYSERSAG